jgi:small subunit ribosomal protein S13
MVEEAKKPTEHATEHPNFRALLRILDKDIDGNESIYLALTRVKGVDFMFSNAICSVLNLPKFEKAGYLTEEDIKKIEDCMQNPAKYGIPNWLFNRKRDPETGVDKHLVSASFGLQQNLDIRQLKKIKCYRGWRHARGLKVRGQRQRRTKKGVLLGVIKKKEAPKTAPAKKESK